MYIKEYNILSKKYEFLLLKLYYTTINMSESW